MTFSTALAQELEAKWILKEAGYKEFKRNTGLQILHFQKDRAWLYTDLELTDIGFNLVRKGNTLVLEGGRKYADIQLLKNGTLRLFVDGTFNEKKVIMELDFVPLLPTKTELSKAEIENLRFEFQPREGKATSKLIFNEELMDIETLSQLPHKEGRKMILEKLDDTYFITFYDLGSRGATLPISEVSKKLLKFYCVPTPSGEVVARGIN